MDKVLYQFHFDFLNFMWSFIPLLVGLVFFFAWKWYPKQNPGTEIKGHKGHKMYLAVRTIGWIVGPFCILIFIGGVLGYLSTYNNIKKMIATDNLHEVSGYVENYHPMPAGGHDTEHFDINGVYFGYSDAVIENGYHAPAINGGVITRDGQHLLIKYYVSNDDIGNGVNNNVIVYIAQLL